LQHRGEKSEVSRRNYATSRNFKVSAIARKLLQALVLDLADALARDVEGVANLV